MKIPLFICGLGIWLCSCNQVQEAGSLSKNTHFIKTGKVDFKTQVQPILRKNCSPCHFPGGRLYDKLPFDKEGTIISQEPGILKRIKKEADIKLVRQFMAQNKVVALK